MQTRKHILKDGLQAAFWDFPGKDSMHRQELKQFNERLAREAFGGGQPCRFREWSMI